MTHDASDSFSRGYSGRDDDAPAMSLAARFAQEQREEAAREEAAAAPAEPARQEPAEDDDGFGSPVVERSAPAAAALREGDVVGPLKDFHWEPQPEGQKIIDELTAAFLERCPEAAALAKKMTEQTGTRFRDWIDTIQVTGSDELADRLSASGFTPKPQLLRSSLERGGSESKHRYALYSHDRAMFPAVLLSEDETARIAIKVDLIADLAAALSIPHDHRIFGEPGAQFRNICVYRGEGTELLAVERHGYRGYSTDVNVRSRSIAAAFHLEQFRRRQRFLGEDQAGFEHANRLIDAAIPEIGEDWACDLFFQAEREYWMRRNRAARVQFARQQSLGLGWANHDHHTYRSSRRAFRHLVSFLEKLGFTCRERFYAGDEAGWGAQVLEQPNTGITVFADVDLTPDELLANFAHDPLPPRAELGTVGLWCGLHGDSFLQAGMHHLECQFDWHALSEQLEREAGIRMMEPFTTFPYLRQAFTEGERWPVGEERVQKLVAEGLITAEQAGTFREQGALGSHLENLERNDGFKGFNQKGVDLIIAATDPRHPDHLQLEGA